MLPNNMREFRRARGQSLGQVARAVGTDRSTLSKIERGKRGASDRIKVALARHFGVSVTRLFDFAGDVDHPATTGIRPVPQLAEVRS